MVKPRLAQPTVKFIDDYCENYRDLTLRLHRPASCRGEAFGQ